MNIKLKRIIICILLFVFSSIFLFSILDTDYFLTGKKAEITIIATDNKNTNSLGNEVWIKQILIDGNKINFSNSKYDSKWEIKDGLLVSYQKKPAIFSWNGYYKKSIRIDFVSHKWSGISEISVDSNRTTVDLFSINPTGYSYSLNNTDNLVVSFKKIVSFLFFSLILSIMLFLVVLISNKILLYGNRIDLKKNNIENVILFIISSVSLTLFLFSFYPGIMTNDSFDQWYQSSNFVFIDVHPVFHTYILFLIKSIWSYPAMVVIVQILLFALIFTYCFGFLNKLGVNKYFLFLYVFLICSFPLTGLMVVTLWKDVMYSIFFILLMFSIFKLDVLGYLNFIKSKFDIFILILSMVFVALLRQNGILVFFVIFSLLTIFYIRKKIILLSVLLSFLIILFIKGPFYYFLNTQPAPYHLFYFPHIQFISSVVTSESNISELDYEVIDNLLPRDQWTLYYSPTTSWNYFISPKFNLKYLSSNNKEINKLFISLLIKNPTIFLDNLKKSTSYIWQFKNPLYITYETLTPTDPQNLLTWNKYNLKPNYLLSSYRNLVIREVNKINNDKYLWVLFTPALYFYLNLFFLIIFLYRNNFKHFLVFIPIVVNIISFFISPSSPEIRYFFPVFLSTFFIFIITFIEIKPKNSY